MNKHLEQLKALTQVLSYTLGKFNVEVTVSGHGAYHFHDEKEDKHLINLPQGDFTDPVFRELSLGFIYHEIGHGINTDYSLNVTKTKALHELHNALEDVWQERATGRRSPGAKKRLARLAELGRSEGLFAGNEKETPFEALLYLALYRGRTRVLGNPFGDFAEAREFELRNMIGDEITDKVVRKVDEIEACENTLTALNIATALMDLIQEEQRKHEQMQQEQQNQESSEDGQSSDNSNEQSQPDSNDANSDNQQNTDQNDTHQNQDQHSSNQDSGGPTQNGSSDNTSSSDDTSQPESGAETENQEESNQSGEQSNGNGGSSEQNNQDGNSGSATQSSNTQPSVQQIRQALEQIASGAGAEKVVDFHKKVAQRLNDMAEQANREGRAIEIAVPMVMTNHPVYKMEMNSTVQRNTAQVFSVLNRVLLDQARTLDVYTRQGKKLVSRKLAGVQAGDFNAFLKKGKSKSTTAAVSLAVDMSGSMRAIMDATNGVAYSFAQGLSKGGVPIEVFYFGGAHVYAAKRFNDKRPSMERFGVRSGGGTPTAEAIQASLMGLMQQEADNKLMFILTDGKPQCAVKTAKAIEYAQAAGVKVIPIFIGIKANQTRGFEAVDPIEIDDEALMLISQLKNAVKRKLFQ